MVTHLSDIKIYNHKFLRFPRPAAPIWNRDSSPTRQLTDTHFEDSSPTELKPVYRQNRRQLIDTFYIVFIWNITMFTI